MIELTQLEQDVLSGKNTNKARAEIKKTQANEEKQVLLEQEQRTFQEQQRNDLAASEVTATEQQIHDECRGLLATVQGFTPTFGALQAHDYINHLRHEAGAQITQAQRNELAAMIASVDARISALEAEKIQLAAQRQAGNDNPEIVGRVGLIMMDVEVLQGIRQKYTAELAELPLTGQHKDWGLEGWQRQIKEAKIRALFSVIEACEKVIYEALQKLKGLQAVSLNYSRIIKAS